MVIDIRLPMDDNHKEQGEIGIKSSSKILWAFPLLMIAAQLLPWEYSLMLGIIFTVAGLTKPLRILLLFGLTTIGHLIWSFAFQYISINMTAHEPLKTVLGRFGLLGYIVFFFIWARFEPCENSYFRFGNVKERLKFPLIWRGFNEYVWRFILVFCAFCVAVTIAFFWNSNNNSILPYGLLFAAVNSFLEEILWRGFILGRAVDFLGEKRALIVASLTFGFYHLSLGFSIPVCLAFAVGGFYMGGCAIKSKGLGASIIMHLFVNMVFVSCGMIF